MTKVVMTNLELKQFAFICSCSSVELIGHYFTRTRLGLYHVKEIGFGVWVRKAFGIKVGFRVMIRDIIGCLVPRVEPFVLGPGLN